MCMQSQHWDVTQVKLYLPKMADNYAEALTRVKRVFAEEYGGFTAYGVGDDSVVGGWIDDDGQLIEEPVVVLETVANAPNAEYTVRQLSEELLEMTDEDAIMATVDGQKIITTE